MTSIVLFGVGSSIVVEYEESCRRLGYPVAAVKNRPGPGYFGDLERLVDVGAIPPAVLSAPCLCPMFTPRHRFTAHEEALAAGFGFAGALLDPTAIVASSSTFGTGTFVNAGGVVGAKTIVAEHVVINRGAAIGHHVEIAAFASVGPGVVVGGHVTIATGVLIGAGAVLLPKVHVGAHAVVGAGSVVVADVPAGATVLGNPARIVEPAVGRA